MRVPRTSFVSAALLAGATLLAAPPAGAITTSGTMSHLTTQGADAAKLLLNGDRVVATSTRSAAVISMTSGLTGQLTTVTADKAVYEIPDIALPYLGRGLNLSLFDLAKLPDDGELPLTVSYQSAKAPAVPGLVVTHTAAGVERGYLTASSARTFAAALRAQFVRDHKTGTYGDGLFSDGTSITLTGATPASTVKPRFTMDTLTVRGQTLSGAPDTGDTIIVLNTSDYGYFGDPYEAINTFYDGAAKFSVPAGPYIAIAQFTDLDSKGNPIDNRVVTDPAITVGSSAAITLKEASATSRVSVSVPARATLDILSWAINMTDNKGDGWQVGYITDGSSPLYSNETTKRPLSGTLRVTTIADLSAAHAGYTVAFEGPSGLIGSQRYVATSKSLARLTSYLYDDRKRAGALVLTALFRGTIGAVGFGPDVAVPGVETEYVTGGPDIIWRDLYITDVQTFSGGQTDADRTIADGTSGTEDWNEFPLHTSLDTSVLGNSDPFQTPLSADRGGNTLALNLTPFGDDTPGHTGAGYAAATGTYAIDVNGKKLAAGSTSHESSDFTDQVTLPAKKSRVSLTLTADRASAGYTLSADISTTWTWASAYDRGITIPRGWVCENGTQHCDSEPLLTLDYHVSGLGLDGVAPSGAQVLTIDVAHQQLATAAAIRNVTAQVSFDGGASWQPASVVGAGAIRYAVYDAPADAKVSLKVTATDAAGASISETIRNAYAITAATAAYRHACAAADSAHATCYVLYSTRTPVTDGLSAALAAPAGWGAKAIEAAYKLPVTRGKGQTIAIVDAYDTPKLATYLDEYRARYGLPACTTANGCFRKVNEKGKSSPLAPDGTLSGWDLETVLDADMVSAACPLCHIVVVEGNSASSDDLATAENTAARFGTVISNSYGARENGYMQTFAPAYDHPHHVVVVAAGDYGFTAASFPANLSTVTAVGGTALSSSRNVRGYTESVWNDPDVGAGSSGCSVYVAKPRWQHDNHCPGRTVADVSALAQDVAIYDTDWAAGGWLTVDGTSAAAPLIAGVYGLAGNASTIPLGYAYSHESAFFDVTSGNNDWFDGAGGASCGHDYLCVAKKGYDAPTGTGTPDGIGGF